MKRFCSIMTQLLQVFSRNEFHQEVKETKAERHARGFASWDHFVAMLFCQLADAQSLREIIGGLTSCEGRLEQFGMKVPKRSTLSYANQHRPWELFRNVFYKTSERCRAELGHKTKFRFKNRLLSLDSSVVTLCSKMFPWATWSRQKGAVKLHLTLDHAGYLPEAMVITTGKYSELTVARRRRYARGTILVMDRGFVDFRWFDQLNQSGVLFMTRIKKDTPYKVVERHPIVAAKAIVSDERIQLTGKRSRKRYPERLRLVTIDTAEGERLRFLTNHMTLAASTIADIYKDRWQIEIFFKLLKQNLRIKSFVGTSANAVWIQIWTALIAMLLIKFLQLKARFGWSYSNLVYFLRMNLLVYRDLWDWLHNPFTAPPPPKLPQQLDLGPELIGTAP
jgi:Transposase DDE domain/Domain of unknown function (DUF4372)